MNAKPLFLLCLCAISLTGICDPTDPPTGADKIHFIPIAGSTGGAYTLVLENATGYAEGAFNKTP